MIKQRVNGLRELMKTHNVQAYLVPSTDAHQSEYLPELWERRKWLSGFTGSAGDLAITADKAGLWTDSRYFLQAEEELKGSGIELFKMGMPGVPAMQEWLKDVLKPGDSVGIDPRLISHSEAQQLRSYLLNWKIQLKSIEVNLVDELWKDRPDFPLEPVKPHPVEFSGESVESKLQRLRGKMTGEGSSAHVLTMLDAIAWLYNIRGTDVEFNPVVISYAIVTSHAAMLFVKKEKVTDELRNHLDGLVEIYDYPEFREQLIKVSRSETKVWLDGATVSQWIVDLIQNNCEIIYKQSPVTLFKAIKNETEIAGFRAAHERDGIPMVKFLYWLENAVPGGGVSELSAAAKLEEFRSSGKYYQGLSFETISGYGEHGAIVHYSTSPETDVELRPEGIYLIDSGGQYLDGTTDITRTVALGKPTAEQKDRFTRVLKGHIRLAQTRFPRGTAGNQLDTIARKPLWDIGLNYGHGTGHGIGSYLNVHEGPHAISYYRGIGVPLEPGMIISNEPGYYKAGEYGMRIENIILTVKDESTSGGEIEFYKFEIATLCPIDLNLVEKSLLSAEEIAFLNEYHQRVRRVLSPGLTAEERAWLENATRSI